MYNNNDDNSHNHIVIMIMITIQTNDSVIYMYIYIYIHDLKASGGLVLNEWYVYSSADGIVWPNVIYIYIYI